MADVDWEAASKKAARRPIDIVEVIVDAPLGGTETFLFMSKAGSRTAQRRLGLTMKPLVLTVGGTATRILADSVKTDRGSRSIRMAEESRANPFDAAKTSLTTGGGFFDRFQLAFPSYFGATVNVYSFFEDTALTLLSQAELMYSGLLENIVYNTDRTVTLLVNDHFRFRDRQIPPTISTSNNVNGAVGLTDDTITVIDADEFTDTALWPSFDWIPPSVLIGTEQIILRGIDTGANDLLVARNYIGNAEDFESANWVKDAGVDTVTDASVVGPWGPSNGTLLEFSAAGATSDLTFTTALGANSAATNFSIWVREHPDFPGEEITLRIENTVAIIQSTQVDFTLTDRWVRVDISRTFVFGAGGVVFVQIRNTTGNPAATKMFISQSQLVPLATKELYTSAPNGAGADAGRGAYGSTTATHSVLDEVLEQVAYRGMEDETAGMHPIWIIRDFLNRELTPLVRVNEDSFQREADFAGFVEFRRTVIDSRNAKDLVAEVREQWLVDVWAAEDSRINALQSWKSADPGTTVRSVAETKDILTQPHLDVNKKSRITRVFVHYNLKTVGGEDAPGDKPEDFSTHLSAKDTEAEGADGEAESPRVIFSRWIFQDKEAIAVSGRMIQRFRLGARKMKFDIDFRRFSEIKTGDTISVESERLNVEVSGVLTASPTNFQVMESRFSRTGDKMMLEVLEKSGRRFGFIHHDNRLNDDHTEIPATPAVDYPAANSIEREHCYVGDASNLVGGTDDGYYIQ